MKLNKKDENNLRTLESNASMPQSFQTSAKKPAKYSRYGEKRAVAALERRLNDLGEWIAIEGGKTPTGSYLTQLQNVPFNMKAGFVKRKIRAAMNDASNLKHKLGK